MILLITYLPTTVNDVEKTFGGLSRFLNGKPRVEYLTGFPVLLYS
jgi:hypothetical protein